MVRTGSITPNNVEVTFTFDGIRVSGDKKVFRDNKSVDLADRELKVLCTLLIHAGEVVTYAQLRHAVPEAEDNEALVEVTSGLSDRLGIGHCIEAVYRRGFRFRCDVQRSTALPYRSAARLAILPLGPGSMVPPYLAEALTEETERHVKTVGTDVLQVIEHDSVSALAGRKMSPAEIGSALQADLLLQPNLQFLPGGYRIRLEMLRGSDGAPLWCYDSLDHVESLAALAPRIASRISRQIGIVQPPAPATAPEAECTPEAYELMWRAHSEWKTLQRHQMQDAFQRLQHAIELAPRWTDARIELANLCGQQAFFGFVAPHLAANVIRRTAEPVQGSSSEAFLPALGWVNFHFDRNLPAAESAFARSAHLHNDPSIAQCRFLFAVSQCRFSEAMDLVQEGMRLDPYSADLHARLAWTKHLAGDTAGSLESVDYALREFPGHELTKLYGSVILAYNGEGRQAVTVAQELVRNCPYLDAGLAAYAYAQACAGMNEAAKTTLEQLEWLSHERYVLRTLTPAVHVALGDYDAAMDDLKAADRARCPWFFQTLADPRLNPLRDRSDFKELADILPRMGAAHSG